MIITQKSSSISYLNLELTVSLNSSSLYQSKFAVSWNSFLNIISLRFRIDSSKIFILRGVKGSYYDKILHNILFSFILSDFVSLFYGLLITLRLRIDGFLTLLLHNNHFTALMMYYVDIVHNVLSGVISISLWPWRNNSVIVYSLRNHRIMIT